MLVVDGLLTDKLGTQSVRIYWTVGMNNIDQAIPATEAAVEIIDNHGNIFPMKDSINGIYSLSNFRGVSGYRYKLHFTIDGKEYESSLQQMLPAGEITDIRYEFAQNVINENDPSANHDAVRIFIDSKGAVGVPALFRWRWTAIYEALTFPELRMKSVAGISSLQPDPLPCSGHIVNDLGDGIIQISQCACCACWVTEQSQTSIVSNNQTTTNGQFTRVQVAQIPLDWQRFQAKYYIRVEQLNLSDDVYSFWQTVAAQREGNGSIFQPNVVTIRGNIKCISDPAELVAGIFSVAGATERNLSIGRLQVNKQLNADTITDDCRLTYRGSTNVKPPFW